MTMVNAFDPNRASNLQAEDAALIQHRSKVLGPAYRLFYDCLLYTSRCV